MPKSVKLEGFIKAKSVQHKSIGLTSEPGGDKLTWYTLGDAAFKARFDQCIVGDHVRISLPLNEKGEPHGEATFLEILEKSFAKPKDTFPTKAEQKIIDDWDTSKSILWQSCMKIAVEIEKAFMCGEKNPTRDEACKNIVVSTNNLYESSLRKYRGLPPIPEAKEE
jgi:hypothetical protein